MLDCARALDSEQTEPGTILSAQPIMIYRFLIYLYLRCRTLRNSLLSAERPPKQMPAHLRAEFTLNGTIPVKRWYVNDVNKKRLKWTLHSPEWNFEHVKAEKQRYYGNTDALFYKALKSHSIRGKEVVILGSESPWYECISCFYGGRVTTIEYRTVDCQIPELRVLTPEEFSQNPQTFDVAVSISSVEHDGLGRYGDPIAPHGDLEAMQRLKNILTEDGVLFLSVPIGPDLVVWNSHRIYGPIRFPMLIDGWEVIQSFGFDESLFDAKRLGHWYIQPVWILKPQHS